MTNRRNCNWPLNAPPPPAHPDPHISNWNSCRTISWWQLNWYGWSAICKGDIRSKITECLAEIGGGGTFFLNHEGTFGNQEGIITWCWFLEHAFIQLVSLLSGYILQWILALKSVFSMVICDIIIKLWLEIETWTRNLYVQVDWE